MSVLNLASSTSTTSCHATAWLHTTPEPLSPSTPPAQPPWPEPAPPEIQDPEPSPLPNPVPVTDPPGMPTPIAVQ